MILKLYISLFLLFVSTCLFSQEKIYIPNFECVGCQKQLGISATLIFSDFVEEAGHFDPIIAPNRDSVSGLESFNESMESAELLSAKYLISGSIIKLEDIYYIKVTLYATSGGMIMQAENRQCNNSNDLIFMLKDLSSSLANDKKMSQPGDLFLVSKSEGEKINRIKSNKSLGVIAGAMLPLSEYEIKNVNTGFGGQASFDLRNFILQSSLEIYFANDSIEGVNYNSVSNRYYNLNINTLYPLSSTNNAPFVSLGAGFSYRESEFNYVTIQGDNLNDFYYDHGLLFNAGGGYILKRNSDASLFIYGRGYTFIKDFDSISYGIMLSFALQLEFFN